MGAPDLNTLVEQAEKAALAGGMVILDGSRDAPADMKGAGDYVTSVDHESERVIAASLYGDTRIPVVGEEGGGETADRYWLVDPLDGTTNFMHGFPAVGVSIALIDGGRPVVGVVHAPFLDQTWSAARGAGAFVRAATGMKTKLRVSELVPERAILATGFPFREKSLVPRHLEVVRRCLAAFEDLRRPGAASLDLAWVASGVFEGFFELNLSSWDVAAGGLLVEEAGGVVSDWNGGPDYLSGDILAASPAVHRVLLTNAEATRAD
jgi:myo-inositol-1(or 4)-monophosphatase